MLWILLIAALLPAIETLVRLLLIWRSSHQTPVPDTEMLRRWLVVIPSRGEGTHVVRTFESIQQATKNYIVAKLLLLDGADAEAENSGRRFGATIVHKEPSGPTKAAALAWLAATSADELRRHDAILVLDVGSTLTPDFFDHFRFQPGCDAMQAILSGTGEGIGSAVAASEKIAQGGEDQGRQSLGWSARLRGTGSALRPEVFIDITKQLRARVEDLEASLLLMARGSRVALGDRQAIVRDEKPQSIYSAASQRSRWMIGRCEALIKHGSAVRQAFVRSPAETAALVLEIFGRPLSLSVPLRIVIAMTALLTLRSSLSILIVTSVLLVTALADVIVTITLQPSSMRHASRLVAAWLLAMFMTPRALFRWMRAKRL